MATILTSSNLSAVSYTAGETISVVRASTLTMTATPSVNPGTISVLDGGTFQILNSSTTTPIVLTLNDFNSDIQIKNDSTLYISGAMMTLGAGDGVNSLSWDFKSLYGGVIPTIAYAEVESSAGSGDYYPWPIIPIDPLFYANTRLYAGSADKSLFLGRGEISKVLFWHDTDKVLSTGNGLTGSLISNGCKVRIPNVYVTNTVAPDAAIWHRINTNEGNFGGNATGGTFNLAVINRATNTTIGNATGIAYNASAATVKTALEGVLGVGNVDTAGGPLPTNVRFSLQGAYANTPLAVSASYSLTGPAGSYPCIYTLDNQGLSTAPYLWSLIDLNVSGKFDVSNACFGPKIKIYPFYCQKFYANRVGIYGPELRLESVYSITFDHFSYTLHPNITHYINTGIINANSAYINKCIFSQYVGSTPTYLVTISNVSKCDNYKFYSFGYPSLNTGGQSIYIRDIYNATFNDLFSIGQRIYLERCINTKFFNPMWAVDVGRVRLGFGGWNGIVPTTLTPRFGVSQPAFEFSYCKDTLCYNFKYPWIAISDNVPDDNIAHWGPWNSSDTTESLTIISSSLDNAHNRFQASTRWFVRAGVAADLTLINHRLINKSQNSGNSSITLVTQAHKYITAKKVLSDFMNNGWDFGQDGSVVYPYSNASYDLFSSPLRGLTKGNSNNANNYVGGNFAEHYVSNSTGPGHVTFGPFCAGDSLTFSGTSYCSYGKLYMPNDGDGATAEIPFAMHAVDSFAYGDPLFYADANGIASNSATVIAPGGPTGGTFTLTVYNNSGSLLGTTTAYAYNVSAATVQTDLRTITSDSTLSVGAIAGNWVVGWNITTTTNAFSYDINGSNLTGGTEPGVAYVYNKARYLSRDLIPRKIKVELQVKNAEDPWPTSWIQLGIGTAPGNLTSSISNLVNYRPYDNNSGLSARLRFTCTGYDPYRNFNMFSLSSSVSPQKWDPADSTITLSGTNPTDLTQMIRFTDDRVLSTFTGSGTKLLCVAGNYGVPVYFNRMDSAQNILMSTYPTTQNLTLGDNGTVNLYYGDQVQVINSGSADVSTLNDLLTSYLDVPVSSRWSATSGSIALTKGQFLALK